MTSGRFVGFLAAFAGSVVACSARTESTEAPSVSASVSAATLVPDPHFDEDHAAAVAANPADAKLELRTAGKKTRFSRGEPVALELSFETTSAGAYELDMAKYDRSGRMTSEVFHVSPAVVDPLARYFEGPMMGGGLRTIPPLEPSKPLVVELRANEWLRFDEPGIYRLFLTSSRLGRPHDRSGQPIHITSNVVEIEILPGDAWAERALPRIVEALHAAKDDEARADARYDLRFLPTKAAVSAMVADLCESGATRDLYTWHTIAGLFGSPQQDFVLEAMRDGLTQPDCAVDDRYLDTIARLELFAEERRTGTKKDGLAVRPKIAELARVLVGALPKKSARVRPTSAYAALEALRESGLAAESPEAKSLRETLTNSLSALPELSIEDLLTRDWPLVRSPDIEAALSSLTNEARDRGGSLRSVSDLALERWLELHYDAARAFVLAELARPNGPRSSFSGRTLGLLKDAELPNLDATFALLLKLPEMDGVSLELRAEVVARYASKTILKDVWAAYKAIDYFRVSLLGYLARHDPKGVDAVIKALKSFDDLEHASPFVWNASLEARVATFLVGPSASRAAQLLAERGTPKAEKLLWDRLRALVKESSPDANEVETLTRAIMTAEAWMTPPARLTELKKLCPAGDAYDACRATLSDAISRWGDDGNQPVLVLWTNSLTDSVSGWLAQYDLHSRADVKARVASLPAGARVRWTTKREDVDPKLMDELRALAATNKIEIVEAPSP
ncbi:MAG: hypothetical protein U0271_43030 [Polyangiaceae bacterium]